ncbi:Spheroidene monooxygenase [Sulfitobacter noctilucicola]|uniref:Spheroidene monooxygenase n=1 Tax=Sulfitobacter noctilucicola TaxID=1342301 RepID=A0A7W6MDI2_9RHOB|nr:spheroidene monooxygenase [Sulfitobacter noctilucicola]KIN70048.1 Spheroidene monooxygenase [Sulfitobacter noctilucicola]MBB4176061.1 spheroidene monooxygenase [Sulfitobacter noctilucicola]
MNQVVSLSFYRFDSVMARTWAFAMMGLARPVLARIPEIGFWKLCGSGSGEGFNLRPNINVFAILTTWPDLEIAQRIQGTHNLFARYRKCAAESWTVYLNTDSVRGQWSGTMPFNAAPDTHKGPLAILTRASVKPRTMARFWGRVPDISNVIGNDPNVLFKIGIGDVPLLHQVTFSIWPDAASMSAFARTGPHADAIRSVRQEDWFREELYARFTLIDDEGTWGGESPLKPIEVL